MEGFSNLRECGEVLIAQFPILRERGDKSYAFDQDGKPLTFVLVPNVFLPYVSQIFLEDGDPGLASEAADFLERMARSNWELCDLFSLEVAPHLLCDEGILATCRSNNKETSERCSCGVVSGYILAGKERGYS